MKRYLLLSSLLLLLLSGCGVERGALSASSNIPSEKYKVQIEHPKGEISGIMAFKRVEGKIYGTIVNEFGVKIFDFIVTKSGKCKLKNVIKMLNKWYIKGVISTDLLLLLNQHLVEDTIEYVNYQQNIHYKLVLIKE